MAFTSETYTTVFQAADNIYLSTKTTELSAGVAALTTQDKPDTAEVAAIKSSRQQGNRGGRGGRRGGNRGGGGNRSSNSGSNNSSSGSNRRGPRHSSNPPSSCCDNHFKWGADCWFCLEPLTCPWVTKVSAKPEKKNEGNK